MNTINYHNRAVSTFIYKVFNTIDRYTKEKAQNKMSFIKMKNKRAVMSFYLDEIDIMLQDILKQIKNHDLLTKETIVKMKDYMEEEIYDKLLRKSVKTKIGLKSLIKVINETINMIEDIICIIDQDMDINSKLNLDDNSKDSILQLQHVMMIHSKNIRFGCNIVTHSYCKEYFKRFLHNNKSFYKCYAMKHYVK